MSEEHLTAVFGPEWVRERVEGQNLRIQALERTVVALRRKLRALDESLPSEYDGSAWFDLEQPWFHE